MCAMMPMLRVRASGVSLGIKISCQLPAASFQLNPCSLRRFVLFQLAAGGWQLEAYFSPAIMRKGLVGFRHAMCVFAFLHGASAEIRRVEQLVRELFRHRLAVAARTRVADEPPDAERQAPVGVH